MKKLIVVFICVCMVTSILGACSTTGPTTKAEDEATPIVLKMGITAPANTPMDNNCKVLAEKLEEISGGLMTIDLHIAGALGSTAQHYTQMKEGTLDLFLTAFDTASILQEGEDFSVLVVPYLFNDIDHYMKFVDSNIFEGMISEVESANGLHFAGVSGKLLPRALSTVDTPVYKVGDVSNLKVRAPESASVVDVWTAWGANPVIIGGGQLYSSLESGLADGQDNDVVSTYDSGLGEVLKYFMEIDYIQQCMVIWMSQKTWDSFTEQQKNWYDEAMEAALEEYSAGLYAHYDEAKQSLIDQGIEFIDVDVDSFREVAAEAVKKMDGSLFSEGLYASIQALDVKATEENSEETITLKIGSCAPESSAFVVNASMMADKLLELSNGTITCDIIGGGALGNVPQHFSQLNEGTLDIFIQGVDAPAAVSGGEDFSILNVPFLFDDTEHFHKFLESAIFTKIMDNVREENDFAWLGLIGDRPARSLSTTETPIYTPSDMQGLVFRVPESPIPIAMFQAWGANTATSAGSAIFEGLQMGQFDGQDNGIDAMVEAGLMEVQGYYMEFNYTNQGIGAFISDSTLEKLSDEQEQWLNEALDYAYETTSSILWNETVPEYYATMEDVGVTIINDVDVDAFRAIVDEMVPEFEGVYFSEGLYSEIRALN